MGYLGSVRTESWTMTLTQDSGNPVYLSSLKLEKQFSTVRKPGGKTKER